MPSFDVDRTPITAFERDDTYLFKHYFERDDVFEQLSTYYNDTAYRFEVPADDLGSVRKMLNDNFYELVVADDTEQFCVVIETEAEYGDILRNAVVHTRHGDANVFVMKDALSVEQAIEHGATRLEETDLDIHL